MKNKLIYPDSLSWLSESLNNFFKSINNEYHLNLFEALNEYVAHHADYCGYFEADYSGSLILYPQLSYDYSKNFATLKRIFFVSEKAHNILIYDSFKNLEEQNKQDSVFNMKFLKKESKKVNKSDEVQTMMINNHIEPAVAKEILLKTSYERNLFKRNLIYQNESNQIPYNQITSAVVKFDLSFLKNSGFLNVKRYSSFEIFFPENYIIDIPVDLDFELPQISEELKKRQLIADNKI